VQTWDSLHTGSTMMGGYVGRAVVKPVSPPGVVSKPPPGVGFTPPPGVGLTPPSGVGLTPPSGVGLTPPPGVGFPPPLMVVGNKLMVGPTPPLGVVPMGGGKMTHSDRTPHPHVSFTKIAVNPNLHFLI